jgi:iron complex transport system substrate-binding protein
MYPQRIVCLTEETTETLYLLGEGDRVVGISGYTVRPPEARAKPKVSSYLHARYEKIEALEPDLILAFSDLQAEITNDLVKRGYPVFTFNQRSVAEILQMVRMLGSMVGVQDKAEALAQRFEAGIDALRRASAGWSWRPRVYFEDWPDPLISGIRWVEELIEIAGGDPVFPALRQARLAKDRILTSEQIVAAAPDVTSARGAASRWRNEKIAAREGWSDLPAVRNGHICDHVTVVPPNRSRIDDTTRAADSKPDCIS